MQEKQITVETEAGAVVVRKLALRDYADLLRSLNKLPQNISKFIDNNDKEKLNDTSFIMGALPAIIADSVPEFCAFVAVATDKDAEFVEALDLADVLEITSAVLQLNRYEKIVSAVKKMLPQKPEASSQPETNPSPSQ
jgi:hypothetical protein